MDNIAGAAGKRGLFTDGDWILSENMAKQGTVGVIQLKHVGVGEFLYKDFQFISESTFNELGCTEVLPGDVLICRMADPIGRACIVPKLPFRAVTAVDVSVLRVDDCVADSRFITHLCNSRSVRNQVEKVARGATRSRITRTELGEITVPQVRLSEQKRIAERLELANRLCRARRYAIELSDRFLPAAFLEFFGDPVANPRGWDRAKVSELGDVVTGNTPPRENVDYYGNAIEWIKSDNIGLAQMSPTVAAEGLSEKGMAVGTVVEAGSLLVTCIAGSETSIGNVVLTDRRVAFNQQINAVIPQQDVAPCFLYGVFLTAKPAIQRKTTQAMKRMITKGKLEELLFFKPPLAMQHKFATLVEHHERLRATEREALRQAEHLFQALLQRAFRQAP
jgi:type I restriction enzyme S subunit